jgi:K+-transporting ATPase KdpF subunit
MTMVEILALAVSVGLLAYLLVAMLKPEWFA